MDPITAVRGVSSISTGAAQISGIEGAGAGSSIAGQGGSAAGSFTDALGDALGQLSSQLSQADSSMASFASGGSADLHTVMLEMQEASLNLKLGVQVRDSLLEAYREIMRLQV
jgi:flagellar hook-basal body complex protein FliE